jgi:hypothetical protein
LTVRRIRGLPRGDDFLFHALALRDIANNAGNELTGLGSNRAQANLDWKFTAVLTSADEIQVRTHGPKIWLPRK